MGTTSHRDKYFKAYESIKTILELTHNVTNTISNIYLIDKETIGNYLKILQEYNIFEVITNVKQRTEVKKLEKKIKDDFGDYILEKNIKIIDELEDIKKKEFIVVGIDFLKNMQIDFEKNKLNKISISVNKDKKQIQLIIMDNNSNNNNEEEEKINIKETKKGFYIYDDSEIDDFNQSVEIEEEKNEKKEMEKKINDPEFDNSIRTPQKKGEENEDDTNIRNEINNNNDNNENITIKRSDDNNHIDNPEIKKAPFAKFDDIINLIYISYENSDENNDIISDAIQQFIDSKKIVNELEEKENLDIVGNIINSVVFLIQNLSKKNQNTTVTNSLINSNEYYKNDIRRQENALIDNDSETSSLIKSSNNQVVSDFNIEINPFNFTYVKIYSCDNCNKTENEEKNYDYYKINLKNDCYNLDDYFRLTFEEICEGCKNIIKCKYKFSTIPEILILKFEKPKDNKKFIKFKIIENIDLKEHMLLETKFSIKYKLLKALYVFNDSEDNKLYVDIPDNEENNYIPYIIFYQKMNDV